MSATELLQRLWTATLALSVALLAVAALRGVWRRAFGSEHACRLWWLPLLAVIASQLPHAATDTVIVRVPAMLVAAAPISSARVAAGSSVDWRVIMATAWIAGIVLMVLLAIWRQVRFLRRMRDAQQVELDAPNGIIEVLRARDAKTGPALVGAWRPRLVLPCDFEQRYDAHERELILAHEAMHARRRDGLVGAIATAISPRSPILAARSPAFGRFLPGLSTCWPPLPRKSMRLLAPARMLLLPNLCWTLALL